MLQEHTMTAWMTSFGQTLLMELNSESLRVLIAQHRTLFLLLLLEMLKMPQDPRQEGALWWHYQGRMAL